MSNLLTVSRLRTWRDCRRKHHLRYHEGWRTVSDPDAIRFGSLIHIGLEAWWEAEDGERAEEALRAIDGMGIDAYEQGAADVLLTAYDLQWSADMDRYEVIAVEESFFAPLLNPETGAASRTWSLAGKIDGVIRDRTLDQTLILEHKTTVERFADDADPYWIKLGMDSQVSHYYLGAESLGHAPEGCLYDVLLRPRLQPLKATPPEKRKYKANGELYARQRAEDETPDEYAARVAADIEANPAKYFARRTIARTDKDIVEYLGDVWAEGRMIREAQLAERAPRNPESCHRFGTCPFWDACAYGVDLAAHPESFERVDDVHPELELEETT